MAVGLELIQGFHKGVTCDLDIYHHDLEINRDHALTHEVSKRAVKRSYVKALSTVHGRTDEKTKLCIISIKLKKGTDL